MTKIQQMILNIPKGKRPSPNTYLSNIEIYEHLNKFKQGISLVSTVTTFQQFILPKAFIGYEEDNSCFVMPKYICNLLEQKYHNNIYLWNKSLSFTSLKINFDLIRIDIDDIDNLNLRIPSGNEYGTNKFWIPGGFTIGNIPEAISNCILINHAKFRILKGE